MKTPTLTDLIDQAEVAQLTRDLGPVARRQTTIEMSEADFGYWWTKVVAKRNRRGEVVLAIQRPDGNVLLHTKPFYPPGVYRLPTGGVRPGEAVLTCAAREAREETGFDIRVLRLAGIVEHELRRGELSMAFVSYVLLAQTGDAPPAPQDTKEQISGFRYVSVAELRTVAEALRKLPDRWADWGALRAPPHEIVAEALLA
jgi:ADP-ribose pyrophosphatase YjhB (NUDIX family)